MGQEEIGKLYQNKHKQIAEDAWVDELVNNILEDLEYCIEVEGQELPIPTVLNKSRISLNMSKEDSDKVIHALKIKGVIAKRHTGIIDDYFVVEDFL
jgi:hypothetical protein